MEDLDLAPHRDRWEIVNVRVSRPRMTPEESEVGRRHAVAMVAAAYASDAAAVSCGNGCESPAG